MALSTYTPIETYTVSGTSTTYIDFSSLGNYSDLVLVTNLEASTTTAARIRFNSDSNTNYSHVEIYGNGSSPAAGNGGNQSGIYVGDIRAGRNLIIVNILNYASSSMNKNIIARTGNSSYTEAIMGTWRVTNPITTVRIYCESGYFVAGSEFTLYGIANSNIGAPLATGGTIVADSNYYYHVFGASGTFTPRQNLTADVLVVAGGGGSGRTGGGGGAGGLRGLTNQSLTTTAYTITVGAGGAGSTSDGGIASSGGNSSIAGSGFTTITASGGGGGASYSSGNAIGASGGSGGGGGTHDGNNTTRTGGAGNAGNYSPVEGYSGGSAISSRGSGGGGGAGGAGGNATSNTSPGVGGVGSLSYSSWGLATGTGENVNGVVYFAGGGTGSRYSGGPTLGGYGGGGAGGALSSGSKNATPNTGGGAGSNNDENGYQGGSGLVIIRYTKA